MKTQKADARIISFWRGSPMSPHGHRETASDATRRMLLGLRRQENVVVTFRSHSLSVGAPVDVPEAGEPFDAVIARGGDFGGWAFYVHEGRLRYIYDFLGGRHAHIAADAELGPGPHVAHLEVAYDRGSDKGATVTLSIDGVTVDEGRVERTQRFLLLDEEPKAGN